MCKGLLERHDYFHCSLHCFHNLPTGLLYPGAVATACQSSHIPTPPPSFTPTPSHLFPKTPTPFCDSSAHIPSTTRSFFLCVVQARRHVQREAGATLSNGWVVYLLSMTTPRWQATCQMSESACQRFLVRTNVPKSRKETVNLGTRGLCVKELESEASHLKI